MPRYTEAAYGGESHCIENPYMRVEVHRRGPGWGWAEVLDAKGQYVGLLEHFGQVKFPGRAIPSRMEAESCTVEKTDDGQTLTCEVRQTTFNKMLARASFFQPLFLGEEHTDPGPSLTGTVKLRLENDAPVLHLDYHFRAVKETIAQYIRGPWLKVGDGSFGASKTDGIFPGIEWLEGEEWSSGTDWFQHPWALRVAPHPLKVTAPVMALSHEGTGIGLAWCPNATNRLGFHQHYAQPVFASPNFVDRRQNHLMGLMFPAAQTEQDNKLEPETPFVLLPGTEIRFQAQIMVVPGDSLDVLSAWLDRTGMPEPLEPRYDFEDALDRIADAYDRNLWYEGAGWGAVAKEAVLRVPVFLDTYLERRPDSPAAPGLREKAAWVREQQGSREPGRDTSLRMLASLSTEEQTAYGQTLLARQREDGSFPFDPEGIHKEREIEHYAYAEDTFGPIGIAGDTALDLCVDPAASLLVIAERTGEQIYAEGARKVLDYCMDMRRPEGGDWWETPLHSPNLLAAGNAAVAYYLGYRLLGDEEYRDRAVHWIRALLPFTHLWQPREHPLLYNTKPCFCSTNWWLANWVTYDVQWEVLRAFAISWELGIDWGEVDPQTDWRRYQKGITVAAFRWMIDHEDPGLSIRPAEEVKSGTVDTLFHDVCDTLTGKYSGALITPDPIAVNIIAVLERGG